VRKQDIKPGVVYAYQRGTYGNPQPVVFLNTPADGELYTESSQYRKPGSKAFTRAREGSKPHAVSFGSDVGYPVVRGRWDADTDPAALLSATLSDFEAATQPYSGSHEFRVVTSLTAIAGPWDEVIATRKAQYEADRQRRERDQQEARASRTRAIDIITALSARDIKVSRISSYGAVDSVSLPLDEAEKLVSLLSSLPDLT
jgi:hypothetical protein